MRRSGHAAGDAEPADGDGELPQRGGVPATVAGVRRVSVNGTVASIDSPAASARSRGTTSVVASGCSVATGTVLPR